MERVLIAVICVFALLMGEVSSATIKNETKMENDEYRMTTTGSPETDMNLNPYENPTGMVTKLDKKSCKCVSLFDECWVEMQKDTVPLVFFRTEGLLRVPPNQCEASGKTSQGEKVQLLHDFQRETCSKTQRYCCKREKVPMKAEDPFITLNNTVKQEAKFPSTKIILRDEVSSISQSDSEENAVKDEKNKNDAYIRPSTLSAILRLLTEGFRFLSNFF